MDFLQNHVEGLIFSSPSPITRKEIQQCLEEMFDAEIPGEDIDQALDTLLKKYEDENFSFQVCETGGGYQFLTKPAYQASIGILLKQQSKKRLSTSALETLSIIAYKQPITKTQVEQIRGVNCDYTIQKLLDKELVATQGKADAPGRPLLYGTSAKFLDYFGINSLNDLPTPKDFSSESNEIGQPFDESQENQSEEENT